LRERAGPFYRVDSPAGGLAASVVRLLERAGSRREFIVTGIGSSIAEIVRLLEHAGARARVHPSAFPDG
jgi:hypothetical protein